MQSIVICLAAIYPSLITLCSLTFFLLFTFYVSLNFKILFLRIFYLKQHWLTLSDVTFQLWAINYHSLITGFPHSLCFITFLEISNIHSSFAVLREAVFSYLPFLPWEYYYHFSLLVFSLPEILSFFRQKTPGLLDEHLLLWDSNTLLTISCMNLPPRLVFKKSYSSWSLSNFPSNFLFELVGTLVINGKTNVSHSAIYFFTQKLD